MTTCSVFLPNSRMMATALRRQFGFCVFLHPLGQFNPQFNYSIPSAYPTHRPVGPGLQIFGLITLPLVVNYALLGWAKKLRGSSSKCWWGHCALVARPTTSQGKSWLRPRTDAIRYVLWGFLVNLTSRVWNFFLMILSEFYVSVFCPNLKQINET